VVYITEAHPSDVWQMESNIKERVVFASPKNEEERAFVAGACVRKLGIQFAAVLDEFGNSTELAYTGWPDRIYLIDGQGKVAYKSKPGPFGFKPGELATALSRVTMAQGREWERFDGDISQSNCHGSPLHDLGSPDHLHIRRVTGKPEVIGSCVGLVPTNALVTSNRAISRMVSQPEAIHKRP
jgi:hypothetical protein